MKTEILDELMEIAPFLASLDRKNSFLVPNGYFENLGNQILPKEVKTSVPEGYFKSLPGIVLHQVNKEAKVYSLRNVAAIAAIFIVGILGIWSLVENTNITPNKALAAELDIDEMNALDEAFEFMVLNDEYEIADLLDLVDEESIDELIFDSETDMTGDPYIDDLFDGLDADQLQELL